MLKNNTSRLVPGLSLKDSKRIAFVINRQMSILRSHRLFCTTQRSPLYAYGGMVSTKAKEERYQKMVQIEKMYDEHSYQYLRELNRNRDYMQVKRLYEKYHESSSHPNSKKIHEQYMFAIENLRALQKAASTAFVTQDALPSK